MKKFFTYSALAVIVAIAFTSCVKEYPLNEGYWLSKERAQVVYSSPSCDSYIVETANGYTVVRAVNNLPYEGEILYGDFSYDGIHDIYDQSTGIIITGEVTDYWLTYNAAQQALDDYCGYGTNSIHK